MQEIQHTISFIKRVLASHQTQGRIQVTTAIEDSMMHSEPEKSIKAIGQVQLLGYQFCRTGQSILRQIMIAVGKNKNGTLHIRVSTDKVRDLYPSPGEKGQGELLEVLNEQIIGTETEVNPKA